MIKSTRSELLRTKRRIVLAKKGHELLKKKQDSLIIEFFKLLKEIKDRQVLLQRTYTQALQQISEVRVMESDLAIKASCLAVQESAPLMLTISNIAGVRVPVLAETETRQTPVYDSIIIQEAGTKYLEVISHITHIAAKETALRKILIEIRKTKRRAHALEHILIPELTLSQRHIQSELEERAREEFTRLKRRKIVR